MTTAQIADGLVARCRAGDFRGAIDAFYHPEIVSVEPTGDPRQVKGIDACRQKADWWEKTFEVHSGKAEGPFVGPDRFSVRFLFDVTNRETGQRTEMDEMALYTVADGKIVREQFFYHMG